MEHVPAASPAGLQAHRGHRMCVTLKLSSTMPAVHPPPTGVQTRRRAGSARWPVFLLFNAESTTRMRAWMTPSCRIAHPHQDRASPRSLVTLRRVIAIVLFASRTSVAHRYKPAQMFWHAETLWPASAVAQQVTKIVSIVAKPTIPRG
jgi:hypothetical protein